jgi:hypothetical protein
MPQLVLILVLAALLALPAWANAQTTCSTGTALTTSGSAVTCVPSSGLLGRLTTANFNTTADQPITINATKYVVRRIVVTNCSASLTLAAGGFYTATSKGGTAVVAAAQLYSALTAATKYLEATLQNVASDVLTATPL